MNNARRDTKARILKAACGLLEREGAGAVSVRRVARRIRVTPMAIYNHYPSLEALLVGVYEVGVNKLARFIWRDLVRAETAEDKLRALVRSYIRFGTRNPNYYSLLFGARFIQKYFWDSPPRSLVMQKFWVPFTEVIELCQETGSIDEATNPQEIATHLWASMHGYVSFFVIGRLQQLWQMSEDEILNSMEKHLLSFLKRERQK